MEPVIEQLTRSISVTARLPDTGVRSVAADSHVFETKRAAWIGLKVAEEVRPFRQ